MYDTIVVGIDREVINLYRYNGDKFKMLRIMNGLTLDTMGERLGKARQQVCIWEHGANIPSIPSLLHICNTFNVAPSFFFEKVSDTVVAKEANHDTAKGEA